MTFDIDEVIERSEEIGELNRRLYEEHGGDVQLLCAKYHQQLAEWLKELKRQREAWEKVEKEIRKLTPETGNWLIDGDLGKQTVCETVYNALAIIDKHLNYVTDTNVGNKSEVGV